MRSAALIAAVVCTALSLALVPVALVTNRDGAVYAGLGLLIAAAVLVLVVAVSILWETTP